MEREQPENYFDYRGGGVVAAPDTPPDAAPMAAPVPPPAAAPIAAPAPAPTKPPTARWSMSWEFVHANKPSASANSIPLDARGAFLIGLSPNNS